MRWVPLACVVGQVPSRTARSAASVDLGSGVAVLGEDGAAMLAENRRGVGDLARRRREFHRQADRLHCPGFRMGDLDEHLARRGLRIAVHLLDVEHRSGRDADFGETGEPIGGAARSAMICASSMTFRPASGPCL
jgi:hypothetical protein